ncbi:MAG: LamG domain-containing protein, partial [Verrucomicrobia bacterium]|nr:LamG domain-containing protein [Verrucomicrobiota bacterium]
MNSPYPTFVAGSSNRYVLQFNTNSAVTRLVSYYQDASSSAYPFGELVTTVPAYNQWNHVVISGTGGTNTRMFINGTLVSSLSHVYPAGISGSNFRLGSGNDNEITFFNGKLDDVRFYTREL